MDQIKGERSSSGVFLASDFRDNLIIDRYDPCFISMRASKKKHLRSENSEDVISWNVFRSLRQITPQAWLPLLTEHAFPGQLLPDPSQVTVELWKPIPPPLSLVQDRDEGISEIDIVIESSSWVWFVEAKWTSDISTATTTRGERDQVLRNIDVGSFYAGTRDFYFSLLIRNADSSPSGAKAVDEYRRPETVRARLPHRTDCLLNLRGVSLLRWSDLAGVLQGIGSRAIRADEAEIAMRALRWLESRGICK